MDSSCTYRIQLGLRVKGICCVEEIRYMMWSGRREIESQKKNRRASDEKRGIRKKFVDVFIVHCAIQWRSTALEQFALFDGA